MSEQPWPLPENWWWTTVGCLSTYKRGVTYKKDEAHSLKQENDVLILRGGNIGEGVIDTCAENVYVNRSLVSDEQFVKKHDIVIVASTGSKRVIGRAGISYRDYEDVAFGAFLILIRPSEILSPRFLDYFFLGDSYRNRIRNLAKGTNINNIRLDYITETPIPLPPYSEQRRIVERIESLFARLDKAKENVSQVSGFSDIKNSTTGNIDAMKRAILARAFHGELGTNHPSEPPAEL